MKKSIFWGAVFSVILVSATTFFYCPTVRIFVLGKAHDLSSWTPEAIERDPVGYSVFVEYKLKKDLTVYKMMRQKLAFSLDDLAKKNAEKSRFLSQGEVLADEFAEAIDEGTFPATLQGREYTEDQLRSQLALTLAEVDGLRESIEKIDEITKNAEAENLNLTVQIEKCESQLSIISAKREVFCSRKLTAEGLEMIAQANAVLEENQMVLSHNPVRTIEQLLQNSQEHASGLQASAERVEEYIQEYRTKKGGKKNPDVQTKDIPEEPAM